jgi:hypothetical protein
MSSPSGFSYYHRSSTTLFVVAFVVAGPRAGVTVGSTIGDRLVDLLHNLDDRLFFAVNAFASHTTWPHAPVELYANDGVVLFAVLLVAGWLALQRPLVAVADGLRHVPPFRAVFGPSPRSQRGPDSRAA